MFPWTLREVHCVSQHMKRSQHASTDNHASNLVVSLRSHRNCFFSRSQQLRSVTKLLLPRTVAVFPKASSKIVQHGFPSSHVRDRPIHPIAPASSVKARLPSLEPKRRLTNNSTAATGASVTVHFPAILVAATRCEARHAGLLPLAFAMLNTPIRTR